MAFPTTGILDLFAGATEDPITTRWSGSLHAGENQLKRLSGQARHETVITAAGASWYDVQTFGANCEAYCIVATRPNDGNPCSVYARVINPGTGSLSGYRVRLQSVAGGANDIFRILRIDNNVSTTLGADMTQEFASGDSIGIECIGNQISAWYKPAAGSWTLLGTRTDATYSAAGFLGLEVGSATDDVVFDDFGGGTVIAGGPGDDPPIGILGRGAGW